MRGIYSSLSSYHFDIKNKEDAVFAVESSACSGQELDSGKKPLSISSFPKARQRITQRLLLWDKFFIYFRCCYFEIKKCDEIDIIGNKIENDKQLA